MDSGKVLLAFTCLGFVIVGFVFLALPYLPIYQEYFDDDPLFGIPPGNLAITAHAGGYFNDEEVKFESVDPTLHVQNSIEVTVQTTTDINIYVLTAANYVSWGQEKNASRLAGLACTNVNVTTSARTTITSIPDGLTVGGSYYIIVTNNTNVGGAFGVDDFDVKAHQTLFPVFTGFWSILWFGLGIGILAIYIIAKVERHEKAKPFKGISAERELSIARRPRIEEEEDVLDEIFHEPVVIEEPPPVEEPVRTSRRAHMVTCQKCGRQNNIEDEYCESCATKLDKSGLCKRCGAPLSRNTNICTNCGFDQKDSF